MGVVPADAAVAEVAVNVAAEVADEVDDEADAPCCDWGVMTVGKAGLPRQMDNRPREAGDVVRHGIHVLKEGCCRGVMAFPPAYCATAASPRAFTAS